MCLRQFFFILTVRSYTYTIYNFSLCSTGLNIINYDAFAPCFFGKDIVMAANAALVAAYSEQPERELILAPEQNLY